MGPPRLSDRDYRAALDFVAPLLQLRRLREASRRTPTRQAVTVRSIRETA